MLDFIFGIQENPAAIDSIVGLLEGQDLNGSLYIGYPVFDIDDEPVLSDALLVTKEHGVIIFDLTTTSFSPEQKEDILLHQDDLHRGLVTRFLKERELVNRRNLVFEIGVVSFRQNDDLEDVDTITEQNLLERIDSYPSVDDRTFKLINAAIQKTGALKPRKKRHKVTREESLGGKMRIVEKEIANLDHWQKKAAIESPDKPQRVRGLAGSGKTIILCLKAAYLHAFDIEKELTIGVTFMSRSLYQQLEKLITKFYYDQTKDDPEFSKLKILHAWGNSREIGMYSLFCSKIGVEPMSFNQAAAKYNREQAFSGACQEALDASKDLEIEPIFDYLLIDEAQDLPVPFFKLAYKFVKYPKHIVWAYDELQNLGEYKMVPPDELFGTNEDGNPFVTLSQEESNKPKEDIMLPICYRNPPWTLTLALALGLGIYRDGGLVRMFKEPSFWKNIGYEKVSGTLRNGSTVTLQRRRDRVPEFFFNLLEPNSSIVHQSFNSEYDQAVWVAQSIHQDLTVNELEADDILVIFPQPKTAGSQSAHLVSQLRALGLKTHMVGANSSRNLIFVPDSIAITHIYRAKGNEAPMVYVMDANYYCAGYDLGKKRNMLFTAITRAKAWVRITGTGNNMQILGEEIDKTFSNNFQLSFNYPRAQELRELEDIYREKSAQEDEELASGFEKIKEIRRMLDMGKLSIEDVPDDLKDWFKS